ncbi:MAG: RHS repeat-associated core domain-containing protein [Reichenbachiella sp.]|uniref:RHS repeat-associated core domain-containing protein n=1 Tax=Reichenbachiella sp. TaxID=2184521 RepID=UPI003264691C
MRQIDVTSPVYFDDLQVSHTHSPVVQKGADCLENVRWVFLTKSQVAGGSFGLSFNSYSRVVITDQNFKFNAGSELEAMTDWYSTPFRKYDPSLGRFHGVDALAEWNMTVGPGSFAHNNPIMYNDPTGLDDNDGEAAEDDDDPGQTAGGGGNPFAWMVSSEFSMHGYNNVASASRGHGGQNTGASAIAGSGDHWSDGTDFSDWSFSGGSDTFRQGLAMGLTYFGGDLYRINDDGSRDAYAEINGELGYWVDNDVAEYGGVGQEKINGIMYSNVFSNDVVNGIKFVSNSSQLGWWGRLMARVDQDIMIMTDGSGGPDAALRKSDGSQARLLNISEVLPAGTTRKSKRTVGNTKMKNVYSGMKSLTNATVAWFGIPPSVEPDTIQQSLFQVYIISQDSIIDESMKIKYKKGDNPFMKHRDID